MLTAKVFELRDSATFIPIIAVLVDPGQGIPSGMIMTDQERGLLRRCGYPVGKVNVILLNARGDLKKANGCCDPFQWGDRTYQVAHNYIIDNWNKLRDGQVIDVEFILGERDTVKQTELLPEENDDESYF